MAIDALWRLCAPLFSMDDGVLPEIRMEAASLAAVRRAYACLESCAGQIGGPSSTWWSEQDQRERPIELGLAPWQAVINGELGSFHVLLDGLRSRSGLAVPALGVFVSPTQFSIDYRAGPAWSASAVHGLFELLHDVLEALQQGAFEHIGNRWDKGGQLLAAYRGWASQQPA
ncbi:MAG: hypothetical protein KDI51_07515 [Xanthomonadales bacterium]|nr:hypothetical protein [Xanthomonadales bacterium]